MALRGVDPSREMLDLALHTLGPLQQRIVLYHGFVSTAPPGPYEGATCLTTLRKAGFSDVALFYAGLSFRAWTAAS